MSSYPELFSDVVWLIISLLICAVFSFLETAITALRLFQLKELAQTMDSYKTFFITLEKHPEKILTTILIATSLSDVTATMMSTRLVAFIFAGLPKGIAFTISIGITSLILLVVGEIIPKNFAKIRGQSLFRSTLWITNATFHILSPFVNLLTKITDYFTKSITPRITSIEQECITSEKEIQFLIDYINEKGLIEKEKTSMLQSIFRLSNTVAKEIMVPVTSIVSINADSSAEHILKVFKKHQFSRFPVYRNTPDNVIGMLHQKDLFAVLFHKNQQEHRTIADSIRPIIFVPEAVHVNQLLEEFKLKHIHIAMVINEFGSIVGLVTLEDVLEEIVGEIRDEHESVTLKCHILKHDTWLVDASVELDVLARKLEITFIAEDALTLGGFLIEQFHRIPAKGEALNYEGFIFRIKQVTPKRILQVVVSKEQRNVSSSDISD
jgi:CBS domain containing-hemolysin-like protein